MEERIKQIISEYGLTISRFADKLGIQRSGISHILSGRNKPSYDFLMKVLREFQDIDANWLLTGKGSMKQDHSEKAEKIEPKQERDSSDTEKKEFDKPGYRQADLFSQSGIVNTESKTSISRDAQAKADYKSKQKPESTDELDFIVFFFKNGNFRRYKPE